MAPGDQPLDADLIRRARAGEEAAFRLLVERWYARIHRWAAGVLGDADDADDVTQDVLVRLHVRLDRFREESAFSTWLFQITRNAARDAYRRRRRRLRARTRLRGMAEAHDVAPDPATALEERDAAGAARAALAGLPDRQREVFDLVDLQGYAPHEAADLLGLSPGTVRTHLFRARAAVRRALLAAEPSFAEDRSC